MTARHSILTCASLVLALAPSARAQDERVDQGSFTITLAGAPLGTESFTISRQGGNDGVGYLLTATRVINRSIVRTSLRTDAAGSPINYQRRTSGDTAAQLSVVGRVGTRLTVNQTRRNSRSSRDYLLRPGTLLLEEDLVHQLYLVGLLDPPRSVAFIAPATGAAATASLTAMDDGEVTLGDRTRVPAKHFVLGSGAATREIWLDSNRRLLRVSIPERRLEAVRDERPR